MTIDKFDIVPFYRVPSNVFFRYQKHWCERAPVTTCINRIAMFKEKTFDFECMSFIINGDTLVAILKNKNE